MEVNGLPLHPLLVHAVVVFVPLAALLSGLYAVLPRWRTVLRWPAVVLAVAGIAMVQLAMMSGEDLQEARGLDSAQIDTHADWAWWLRIAAGTLAVLVLVAAWLLPSRSRSDDRQLRADVGAPTVLTVPVATLLVAASVAVLALAFLTGEAGARAVWG
jgi:hypothetical protein